MNLMDIIIPPKRPRQKTNLPAVIANPTSSSKVIPDAKARLLVYGKVTRPGGSGDWNDPEFDFKLIAMCLSTESIFRRTVDKYVELIWRNGYKLVSKDTKALEYIRHRIKQISISTRTPFDTFLKDIAQQLVTYSNCFIERVRSSSTKIVVGGATKLPAIGFYVIDATSMKVAKNQHGRVIRYRQEVETQEETPEWVAEDIVHIVRCREPGLTFGTPMVAPVIDDMRALRRMEENVEMLVFNYAMPLYQYKVGDLDHPADDIAIRQAEYTLRDKPADGLLVTPYYHQVSAVGAEGRAIRMEGYLDYFRDRIFSGLGTSAVALGLGGGSNRSTSEVLERSMHGTVKDIQDTIKLYIQDYIFDDLLLDGGFSIDNEENRVQMFFPEIDIDTKIKLENHSLNMYHGNMLGLTESREIFGKDPMSEEQYLDTYLFNVDLPKTIAQAVDEPFLTSFGTGTLKRLSKFAKAPAGVRSAIRSYPQVLLRIVRTR
jgi:hypothetical protein